MPKAGSPRVAINGFGRIGRTVFRLLCQRDDIRSSRSTTSPPTRRSPTSCASTPCTAATRARSVLKGDTMTRGRRRGPLLEQRDPAKLPWGELGVDIVVEATGRFRKREECARHLEAGAKRVILTVPAKDEIDATIVVGVNDRDLRPEHRIVSNASCTTNCLAPVAKVLHEAFGIEEGLHHDRARLHQRPAPGRRAPQATSAAPAPPPRTSSRRPRARRARWARCCRR